MVKGIFLLILLIASAGVVAAQTAVSEVNADINSYNAGTITQDELKTKISEKYAAGTLTRENLKTVLTVAYRHNKLERDDVRFLLGEMYKGGKLTRADLNWILTKAYNQGELTRDDIRFLITKAYQLGELTRSDVKYLVTEAYKRGELKRSDIQWILTHAYKKGELTRDDLKWLLNEAYKAGELTREDMRVILTAAYNQGELTRDDVKWLLEKAYEEGVLKREDVRIILTAAYNHGSLTREDVKWILTKMYNEGVLKKSDIIALVKAAYKHGELRKSDIKWLLDKIYQETDITAGDVSVEDVTAEPVVEAPAAVPSVPEITEPNAPTAEEAVTATTFDETETVAPAESVLRTKQTWMLYKYALIKIEKTRIGMEALIGYVEDKNGSTAELETLKDEFVLQAEELESAAERNDRDEAKAIIDQMKATVSSFRTEARAQVGENTEEAREAIKEALEDNEDYLDSLVTEAREAKRDRNLEVFDLLNARAQGRIDKAGDRGVNVTALQAKLDEIKEKRSEFIEAMNDGIESCEGEGIGECTTPEGDAYKALRDGIKNDYRELRDIARQQGQGNRIANAITNGNKVVSKVEELLNRAEERGRDVTVEKAKLDEVKNFINSAEEKYNTGDYEGAKEDLKSAREAFKSLMEEIAGRRAR